MILLDTDIISELLGKTPEPKVGTWLAARDGAEVYLSAVSETEPPSPLTGGRPDGQSASPTVRSRRSRAHGAAVATRNVRDFEGCGIDLIDPWQGPQGFSSIGNDR